MFDRSHFFINAISSPRPVSFFILAVHTPAVIPTHSAWNPASVFAKRLNVNDASRK